MSNCRTRMRDYQRNYYGGYCNKCKDGNLEPVNYTSFKDMLDAALELYEFKKDIMNYLINNTR